VDGGEMLAEKTTATATVIKANTIKVELVNGEQFFE
jgi:hypothetical protein